MSGKVFGIDFGTSTIKIYKKNEGVIFDAKNIIAVANGTQVIAIGDEAYEMYGKAPSNILVDYPVRSGVIADIANMLSLLNLAFDKHRIGVLCNPCTIVRVCRCRVIIKRFIWRRSI